MPSDSGACLLRCALFDLVDHVRPLCAGQNGCNVARQEHHATTFYILQPDEARNLATWPATSRKVVAHFKQKYDGIAPTQAKEYGGVGGFDALACCSALAGKGVRRSIGLKHSKHAVSVKQFSRCVVETHVSVVLA